MSSTIKKTLITLGLFLAFPVVILLINWQWQPQSLNITSEYLFWITETAGMPWAILSCIFFTIVFAICLKMSSNTNLIKLLIILVVAISLGQVIKSIVKNYTADSRPFVLWIEQKYHVDDDYFYSLPRKERVEIIKEHISSSPDIPNWLYQHWCNETGYTFPSGHTLFATTWAFLALFLLNFKRFRIVICAIIVWAIFIGISRMNLGMHHPIDVICGSILALFISWISYYLAVKWQVIKQ